MMYLEKFSLPTRDQEFEFFNNLKRQCYTNFYPFQTLNNFNGIELDFEPITVLYGGNGSGKTTILNVISEKLQLERDSVFNQSNFLGDFLALCHFRLENPIPQTSRIITSDDVFDYALNVRSFNNGIDFKREEIFEEYLEVKYAQFQMKSLEDYERLKQMNDARRKTQSRYTRDSLIKNVRTHSNGENAFRYFTEKITENALFLLDEPENSLSPQRQLELKDFIEKSTRYFGCQFILATHSPFLLSLPGAKVYDLDDDPVSLKHWTELEHVKAYYQFFKSVQREFEG
jgi:predicted ATPase